jgi:hypothetical protein
MNVQDVYFEQIVKEIATVDELWKKSVSLEERLYYFSAIFGTINRVMNFYCDPLLVFVHQILQEVHQSLTNRLKASRNPAAESFLVVPPEMIDALFAYVHELKAALESRQDSLVWMILQKMSNLAYATTGNGYYLYLKGEIKL